MLVCCCALAVALAITLAVVLAVVLAVALAVALAVTLVAVALAVVLLASLLACCRFFVICIARKKVSSWSSLGCWKRKERGREGTLGVTLFVKHSRRVLR